MRRIRTFLPNFPIPWWPLGNVYGLVHAYSNDRNNHFQAIDRVNHASHRPIQLSPLCRRAATLFLASDTHAHIYKYMRPSE